MTDADLSAIREDIAATIERLRAIEARLGDEAVNDAGGVPAEAQSSSKIDVSDPKRWLPMSIAAKRARITPRRMVDWIEDGRVRAAKLEGRVFIDATTILAEPVQPSRSA